MKNKKLKGILYLCAILVLFALGLFIWMKTSKIVEEKTFTIKGQQEAIFEYNTKIELPKAIRVHFDGKLDCDAILIIKENGEGNAIRFRRSFPLKAGELKDYDFQTTWTHPGMIIELRSKDCEVNDVEIHIEVEG
ncbi:MULTISPECIES: hypothetical protein [Butyricimonas]|jgi:hypothetical protein|uniref:Uncharacterized protein n=1 Tax=Butyricimonas hominis TaxID=2763032 RepID=A0ABR7CXT1_9BACT|nr:MULTISPECIES: hypothetical protein [Butyricimonas]MBC5620125.1 hypothetical protein [Butyricimonas hominis]